MSVLKLLTGRYLCLGYRLDTIENLDEGSQCKLYLFLDTISSGILLPTTVQESGFSFITRL